DETEEVVASSCPGCLEAVCELTVDRSGPESRASGPNGLAVQGMSQTDGQPSPVPVDNRHPPPLGSLKGRGREELLEQACRDGFAESDHLQEGRLIRVEIAHSGCDHLLQSGTPLHGGPPAPHPVGLAHCPAFGAGKEELSQEKDVAPARFPELCHGESIDVATE